jgi:hypothetical protein
MHYPDEDEEHEYEVVQQVQLSPPDRVQNDSDSSKAVYEIHMHVSAGLQGWGFPLPLWYIEIGIELHIRGKSNKPTNFIHVTEYQ